jgi:hypothetical protein
MLILSRSLASMKNSAEEMLAKQEQTSTVFHASMRDGGMEGELQF